MIELTKKFFYSPFPCNTQTYLHQSAVTFSQPEDGDGPGGEGAPRPGPVALLGPSGAEGRRTALASRVSGKLLMLLTLG